MNRVAPDIMFLDLTDTEESLACAFQVQAEYPATILIGFGAHPAHFLPIEGGGFAALLPDALETRAFIDGETSSRTAGAARS